MKRKYKITKRESEILNLLVNGISLKEIAVELSLRDSTVKFHFENIKFKMNTFTVLGTIVKSIRESVIPFEYFNLNDPIECYLTSKEKVILELLVKGYTSKEMAKKLFNSRNTIENHKKNIIKKVKDKPLTHIAILFTKGLLKLKTKDRRIKKKKETIWVN